jgi:asparagine synthase (glutamine-hydrolysing)
MCGICGIIHFDKEKKVSQEALRSLNESMVHRGPDDDGYLLNGPIGLGHRRLSIIDLSKGRQPIYSEDRSVAVVFNGEIYNFRELREDLQRLSHLFSTDSDTEVLVHGYEQWGIEGLLERCNGMFAFCLYDMGREILFLVRDRLGKKPFYYVHQKGSLIFASEVRGLVTGGFAPRDINPIALNHYIRMHFSYGEESLVKGVKRVLPGHYIRVGCRNGNLAVRQYWILKAEEKRKRLGFQDYRERLDFLLRDSVRLRRIADVPVGTFLSGGLDSSIVTGLLAEMVHPLNTFSIGIEGSGFGEDGFDESAHSFAVSSFYHTEHHHLPLTGKKFADLLVEIMGRMDEPIADAAIVPTYWLSREARKTVTVVLTGEGADELFAGYEHYEPFLKRHLTSPGRLAFAGKCLLGIQGSSDTNGSPQSHLSGFPFTLLSNLRKKLIHPDYLIPRAESQYYLSLMRSYRVMGGTALDQALMADMRSWLVDDVLMKLDKMSMLHSLEARAPFLDYRLVEFALTIPDDYRIRMGIEKHILRESFRNLLPPAIVARKKQGFNLPMGRWLKKDFASLCAEFLSPGKIRQNGFFDEKAVSALLAMHDEGGTSFERIILTILMLQMWWDSFRS